MSTWSRLLSSSLCFSLLFACGPIPEDTSSAMESQPASLEGDDSHSQGTRLHGTQLVDAPQKYFDAIKYADAVVQYEGSRRTATLELFRGEIIAKMDLRLMGSSPSLVACASPTSGPERSCGFTADKQGVCTPGTQVTLSSGNCVGTTGSCTGSPIVRVCAGESPCEHQGPGYLGSATTTPGSPIECSPRCPKVTFTCPASGIYTALKGPYTSGQTDWSAPLRTLAAPFYPATQKRLAGLQLIGARIKARTQNEENEYPTTLEIVDALNADSVSIPESPGSWDTSGDTYLYRVKVRPPITMPPGTPSKDLCTAGADPVQGWAWAVPLSGKFTSTGDREESNESFTLACDPGVLAKCYRWGYKPWLETPGNAKDAHWACTRMARADYCGNGTTFTQDGTKIRPWDDLSPSIISAPQSPTPADMAFEAGWNTQGPACLSHWRWQHLPAPCVQLNAPQYDPDGTINNDCRTHPEHPRCAQICDTPAEAKLHYQSILFNESKSNQLPQP
ncbi:ADYC domain-containing protein [Myxococcus stipitatus]|uniref:ADYC domain-containing protein n=1 Tax=Myxococcus stipitatus TaxID=83455 RepID=UPI0030D20D8D